MTLFTGSCFSLPSLLTITHRFGDREERLGFVDLKPLAFNKKPTNQELNEYPSIFPTVPTSLSYGNFMLTDKNIFLTADDGYFLIFPFAMKKEEIASCRYFMPEGDYLALIKKHFDASPNFKLQRLEDDITVYHALLSDLYAYINSPSQKQKKGCSDEYWF